MASAIWFPMDSARVLVGAHAETVICANSPNAAPLIPVTCSVPSRAGDDSRERDVFRDGVRIDARADQCGERWQAGQCGVEFGFWRTSGGTGVDLVDG
jgi:hypothetical protein